MSGFTLSDFLGAPAGPGTPFANPILMLADGVRVLLVLIAVGVLVRTRPMVANAGTELQAHRLIGMGFFALTVGFAEVYQLGDWPTYRLVLIALAMGYAASGYRLLGFRRTER